MMKKIGAGLLFSIFSLAGCAQNPPLKKAANDNTLLWKVSGKNLKQPSYIFGTIHMICADDALLSDNMKTVIKSVDEIYLEVDMDDMMQMFSLMGKMKMNDGATLRGLLSEADYELVKEYFTEKGSMLPFSMLETFKPLLATSLIAQNSGQCETMSAMETVIMGAAKDSKKEIKGLESMAYQAGILDSIPYKVQAELLVQSIKSESAVENGTEIASETNKLFDAYKSQNLEVLENLMIKSEAGLSEYMDLLLFKRNHNWIAKMKEILPAKSVLIAVGAGHLPGDEGVLNLLKKEGYTVEPIDNSQVKEI
jgi:uncharacterized protein YbaP (TraB family)